MADSQLLQSFSNKGKAETWAKSKGYSLAGGNGLTIVGQVRYSSNNPRSGQSWSTVPVYGASKAASQSVPQDPVGSLNSANDGSYGSVMANLSQQGEAGKKMADQYASMAVKPVASAPVVPAMQAQTDQQTAALQALMLQQQREYAATNEQQQAQLANAEAALAEQKRQAAALREAFIPALNPTASAPVLGDARRMPGAGRPQAANLLSTLSILRGSGRRQTASGMSPTLAGLQIA